MRRDGSGCSYDAIIGLSGGIDSAYLALMLAQTGLRMLAVHVDAGWNTAAAVGNIERVVKGLGLDLITTVVDWQEMRDLQRAFLRAGVPNQDIPQDHVFFAALRHVARSRGIRHFISGANLATESVLPRAWGYNAMDALHVRAIHRRFGEAPIKRIPLISYWRLKIADPIFTQLSIHTPLDWMPYDRAVAQRALIDKIGWNDYGGKHRESQWTSFFQSFWLPIRFGFDKRRAHLSSMILSNQMRREVALVQLEQSPFSENEIRIACDYVARKLDLRLSELSNLLHNPSVPHTAYPSLKWITDFSSFFRRCSSMRF